jgi:expansin (peptidoglycan-binding protein)
MPHMDLSQQAFQKIADVTQGVAGARWRVVACPPGAPHK